MFQPDGLIRPGLTVSIDDGRTRNLVSVSFSMIL